ncbi:MAG: hypothetical protein JXR49_16290 [Acidobacteria bacterium]|nr:hypothetical protein [Acidobacteriota bacterium]
MKKTILILTLILVLAPISVLAQINPASEDEKSLLHESEIIDLMARLEQMPVQQQKEKIEQLWANDKGSKTPRSDFLYCSGFAYLDHYKAQACLGRAFENGRGIVQDNMDAYIWYTIALDHTIDDAAFKEKLQARQTHIKQVLVSVYPAPSDYELEDAVKKQKEKIEQYTAEIPNSRQ